MSTKKIVGIVSGVVVLLCVVWVLVAAAGIGGEASRLDSMLKQAVDSHTPIAELQTKIASEGFDVKPDQSGLSATGPAHWAVIYKTWLTISVTGGPDGLCHGYHLDRSGEVF